MAATSVPSTLGLEGCSASCVSIYPIVMMLAVDIFKNLSVVDFTLVAVNVRDV